MSFATRENLRLAVAALNVAMEASRAEGEDDVIEIINIGDSKRLRTVGRVCVKTDRLQMKEEKTK